MKKIIVAFFGSFNPPLYSHFSLAQQVLNTDNNIENIIFVPVNSKYKKAELIENEHRCNMLKLVCNKNKKFLVSSIELDSSRPLYTIETLEILKTKYPNNIIYFAIGEDNLKELHTWNNAESLIKNYKIFVFERTDENVEQIINQNELLNKYKENFIKMPDNLKNNISSTFVREQIKEGKSIKYLTTDEICEYIKENNLYKAYGQERNQI